MENVINLLSGNGGPPLIPIAIAILATGAATLVYSAFTAGTERSDTKRRLQLNGSEETPAAEVRNKPARNAVRQRAARTTQDFYTKGDPENVARLRLKLIRAGYMEPGAVGTFFLIRFAALVAFALAALLLIAFVSTDASTTNRAILIGIAGVLGYFLPGLVLSRMVAARMIEYRNGFPDFMDLMIVCSDAGMSMEAGIERVSRELETTYPTLSQHLQLLSIELRVGRNLEDALRSLGDRLSLEEVRSFATLLRQSKELGTSLSGALRVFSDEMRHKRMSLAEEKAHALPAKLSVPVTVCILPVVLMVAIIPVIVKVTMMQQ